MPPPSDTPQNPHAAAAGAYGASAQKHTPDQRELEGHVLLKSAKFMQDLQNDWEKMTPDILEETLKYNRQIWMLFYDAALENPEGDRPNDLRSNIINLANFVFKRELDLMAAPEKDKLTALININREIAAGLMTQAKNDADAQSKAASQQEEKSTASTETTVDSISDTA